MNEKQLYQDYLDIAEICQDDLNIVVQLIAFHHTPEEKLSRIQSDITEYRELERLERYEKTFDRILSLPAVYIRTFVEIKLGHINRAVIKIDRNKIEEHKDKQYKYKPPKSPKAPSSIYIPCELIGITI